MNTERFSLELVELWNELVAADKKIDIRTIGMEIWGMCRAAYALELPNAISTTAVYFAIKEAAEMHGERPRYSAMNPKPPKEWDAKVAETFREKMGWSVAESREA